MSVQHILLFFMQNYFSQQLKNILMSFMSNRIIPLIKQICGFKDTDICSNIDTNANIDVGEKVEGDDKHIIYSNTLLCQLNKMVMRNKLFVCILAISVFFIIVTRFKELVNAINNFFKKLFDEDIKTCTKTKSSRTSCTKKKSFSSFKKYKDSKRADVSKSDSNRKQCMSSMSLLNEI